VNSRLQLLLFTPYIAPASSYSTPSDAIYAFKHPRKNPFKELIGNNRAVFATFGCLKYFSPNIATTNATYALILGM
jgi:hypothetical protein